jgi:outer membrane protein OmpA-like peptidoglycan-associated protein
VAAGEYVAGTGGHRALLDVETAGVWAAVVAPLPSDASPSGASSGLRALSCPSPGACVAVGTYELASGNEAPLVETDEGGAWSARSGPLPSDAATRGFIDSLDAVSCTVAMDCAAVGLYVDGAGSQHPHALLDVAIDGAWLPGTVEVPADANTTSPYSMLDAVSCTALASCVAAGLYLDVHGDSQALLDAMSVALVSIPLTPSAPSRPHAVPEHGQAKISWSVAASLGGSPVTRYVATASPGGATCSSTATRCTVWGLTPHDRYTFRVVAASSLGSSPPSAPSAPITVAARIPASFVVRPFAEGSSALTPASRAQLARIASIVFADGDTRIVLVGYSDDRGAPGIRVELSARRAAVVERFLRRALGALGSSRMEFNASARGSANPVASNRTAIGRSANRRVTIVAT